MAWQRWQFKLPLWQFFIAIVATRRNRTQYVIYPYNFDYRNFRTLNDDDIRHLLTNKSTNYGNFAFNQIR